MKKYVNLFGEERIKEYDVAQIDGHIQLVAPSLPTRWRNQPHEHSIDSKAHLYSRPLLICIRNYPNELQERRKKDARS
jgi:hypothetical protein